jgi:hypothetical protein
MRRGLEEEERKRQRKKKGEEVSLKPTFVIFAPLPTNVINKRKMRSRTDCRPDSM